MANDLKWQGHTLQETEVGWACSTCNGTWADAPRGLCPGIPVLVGKWKDVWPEGMRTKTQLRDAGYETSVHLPSPAFLLEWSKSPAGDGYLRLYNPAEAVKLDELTDDMQAALRCDQCGKKLATRELKHDICDRCEKVNWARGHLVNGAYILDSETTGLGDCAEIVELSIIDTAGNVIFNSRIRPRQPEAVHEVVNGMSAYDVHGISAEMLQDAPPWDAVAEEVSGILSGKMVLIYNRAYDEPLLQRMYRSRGMQELQLVTDCVMLAYAQYVGVREKRHGSWGYRWQKLQGGDHSALGDCFATLDVLKQMAGEQWHTDGDASFIVKEEDL